MISNLPCKAADQKSPDDNCDNYLKLPALEKQFLISPPCSPPVGWEQSRESEPVVNFELLSRLASLATGKNLSFFFIYYYLLREIYLTKTSLILQNNY